MVKLYEVDAGKRKEITFACAGDIVCVYAPGMNAITGDTISSTEDVLLLEEISFPKPLIKRSLHPERVEDKKKVLKILEEIEDEDPTFGSYVDELNSEIIIQGMGELHLETIVDRIEDEFKLKVTCGEPRPEYNERITKKAKIEHLIKKQTGGPGSFGYIEITFEPLEENKFEFVSEIKGAQLKNEYISAVERGVRNEMNKGLIAGYPVLGVKATLHEGKQHVVDSNRDVFILVGEQAFRKAKSVCEPVIFEPIMKVDVVSGYDPNDNKNILSSVISTLTRKRGTIEESRDDTLTNTCYVSALVPLVGMFGYIKVLRQETFGRGNFTMVFSHYEQLPQTLQDELMGVSESESLKK
jgi:elongation factor G